MTNALKTTGGADSYITTPNIPAINNATDVVIILDAIADSWSSTNGLFGRGVDFDGFPFIFILAFPTTGIYAVGGTQYTVNPLNIPAGRRLLRLEYDGTVSEVNFLVDGVSVGTPSGAPANLGNTATYIDIGSVRDQIGFSGFIYSCEIIVGGVTVSFLDFTSLTIGQTSINDAQGNTWTLAGGAAIVSDAPPLTSFEDDDLFWFFDLYE